MRCFYILDEKYDQLHPLGFPLIDDKRKSFLDESIQELKKNLLNLGIKLTVIKDINNIHDLEILDDEILTYQKLHGTEELKL